MRSRCSRFLAGLLTVVMVVSSGGYEVMARGDVRQLAVVDTKEEDHLDGDLGTGEEDSRVSEEDTEEDLLHEGQEEDSLGKEDDLEKEDSLEDEEPLKEEDALTDKGPLTEDGIDNKDVVNQDVTGGNDGQDEGSKTQEEPEQDVLTKSKATAAEPQEEPEEEPLAVSANSLRVLEGSVEVQIISGVSVNGDQTFEVELSGPEDCADTVVLPSRKKGEQSMAAPSVSVRFPRLSDGTYQLRVSGEGYLTYTQSIKVDKMGYRVQLYTGNAVVGTSSARPGLLFRGDVNGDGVLDDKDATVIVDTIESGVYDARYDLDKNGSVDLVDLNYLTDMLEHQSVQQAIPEEIIPPETAKVSVSAGTAVEGSLEGVLEGKGIKLSPASGEISEHNGVELEFDFEDGKNSAVPMEGMVVASPRESENGIANGQVLVTYVKDGKEVTGSAVLSEPEGLRMVSAQQPVGNFQVSWNQNRTMVIDFGSLIAVKKVVLVVTKTSNASNLAEISKVEFLNDMEKRIPEPEMNIPKGLSVTTGNKQFALQWNKESNVTSYEISIASEDQIEYRRTTATTLTITQFQNDKLENGTAYTVRVQSVNGEWKSGFSEAVQAVPRVDKVPPAPDRVHITSGIRSLEISWSKTEDADSYTVYYREKSAQNYEKVSGITGLYYQLEGLKDDTTYEIYVTASNDLGEGKASALASEKTLSGLIAAKLPEYKLINTSNGEGVLSSHIKDAYVKGIGTMIDSPLDTEAGSALGLFDNRYDSYMECKDWDYGGAYPSESKGMFVELDQVYPVGMISLAEPIDVGSYIYLSVYYWNEAGQRTQVKDASIVQRSCDNGRKIYLIKFKNPVETSKLQFGIGRYGSSPRLITVSEVRIHEYDSLEQDILGLYADNLHIMLREDVTEETLDALQKRLDTQDHGEYHPERSMLQKELDTARKLLETQGLGDVLQVNPMISASKDNGISVGGLNAWQPLGVAAAPGDDLVVYVGRSGMREGAGAALQLVYTQYHAESGGFFKTVNLKIGRNEISLEKLSSTTVEKGGALYVQYTGNNDKDDYAVRVSGGGRFPVLNLYGITDTKERSQKINTYVTELNEHISQLQAAHKELHADSGNENLAYDYESGQNCILNSTDIVIDQMMFSLPATQVAQGLGGNKEAQLENALTAMEEMLVLFYQHKGLTNSFAENTDAAVIAKNHLPYRYLNIRYMRMFAGAFMYASGNHIGIEWGSAPGMMSASPVQYDKESGKHTSGQYFGWGIAHEIGHDINEGAYAHAEVTNNYFSILAQAQDNNTSVRFQYPNVYDKVTSGTTGYASNVFTQLGMYWQLHLAYDRDYNYKTYGTYQEIFEHLFFARVDSYARNPASAPAPGGVALTLSGDRDQKLMRLASAAAEKDLSEFFERWGMMPDAGTLSYMKQFDPETRAIYYGDDDSRVYTMEHAGSQALQGKDVVTASASVKDSQVTLTMSVSAGSEVLHGYEISRIFVENGKEREEIAGFTTGSTFTDQVAFAANHVVRYQVTAIDRWMNRSLPCKTNASKIQGDGKIDKSFWTMATNMSSEQDTTHDLTEGLPCEAENVYAISLAADDDDTTTFTGSMAEADPYVLLQLNQSTKVTALRYQLKGGGTPITDYRIEVSMDGENYTKVKEGTFNLSGGVQTVYFENGKDPWVCTYDAVYIKLTAVGQSGTELSITELDLFGPSGDNVELLSDENGQPGIGVLKEDFVYEDSTGAKIPAGSIIFTGAYKGNPAYNVFILYDADGTIVGGTDADGNLRAEQIILAPEVTDSDAMLGETSEGRWVYWLTPDVQDTLPSKVRAEMFRVDNALTNEGQRMVSDTPYVDMPADLPEILLTKGSM